MALGAALERVVPEAACEVASSPSLSKIIGWPRTPDDRFGPDPAAARDALLFGSLKQALVGPRCWCSDWEDERSVRDHTE